MHVGARAQVVLGDGDAREEGEEDAQEADFWRKGEAVLDRRVWGGVEEDEDDERAVYGLLACGALGEFIFLHDAVEGGDGIGRVSRWDAI